MKREPVIERIWRFIPPRWLEVLRHPLGLFLAWLARTLSGVHVRWHVPPDPHRPRLYYFNHSSHADSVLLWSCLPEPVRAMTRFVAAEDYWTCSSLRRYFAERVFHAIFVSRSASTPEERAAQVERILEGAGKDYSLIFSPEGTRSDGGEVQPFKAGLYYLCKARPDLEIVPVYLENLNRLLPKGEYLPLPLLCSAIFGAPLRLETGEEKAVFLERAREALVQLGEP